jgi:hypothetical protein
MNTLLTTTWIVNEVARGFENEITFIRPMMRQYDDQYKSKPGGGAVGDTVHVRLAQRYTVTHGSGYEPQDLYNETVPISIDDQIQIAFGFSSQQKTLELSEVRKMYVDPAAQRLAAAADMLGWDSVYRSVWNTIGTPGAGAPSTVAEYLAGGVKLSDGSVALAGRIACLDHAAMAAIAGASMTLFNPSGKIGEAFRKGQFGSDTLGFAEWNQDSMAPVHTTGTFTASTPLVNGANQTGSSLVTDGWASGETSLKHGDVLMIANVYSVLPGSQRNTGRLQEFTVKADISDTTGDMTIAISPPIITSGALQTVSASPADGAAITVKGATSATNGTLATTYSKQSMLYTKDAFAFVMADLVEPNGGAACSFARSKPLGISVRYVEQYGITTDTNMNRLDILVGCAAIQPRHACRVWS